MVRLRQYKFCDSVQIADWVRDEDVFRKWGGERFGDFPISAEVIDEKYRLHNGDCIEPDNFYPWVAVDDAGCAVGHFIMRYLQGDSRQLRFGWVVVDAARRGQGCGKQMLTAGLKYAFELLGADRITLGVFVNNKAAHRCYLSVGFRDTGIVGGTPWDVMEMEITKANYRQISAAERRL